MYMHARMPGRMYTYAHVCVRMPYVRNVCMRVRMYVCMYVRMYVCMHVRMYARRVCMRVGMCVHVGSLEPAAAPWTKRKQFNF